ncbi:MAG TPA: hypothetical protein VFB25_09285 [Gaiellaceae bacterium]|nr:hypothetical protein [Gaiellaceae bacterium]
MRRHRIDLAVLLLLATGVTVYVSLAVPGDRNLVVHVYVLFVGALLMTAVLISVGAAAPPRRRSEFRRALDERAQPHRQVSELARFEREVTLAVGSAHDFHVRLRPHLSEIAQARLERTGRRAGPQTLGRWWELLAPDRPEPRDRFAPGIREAQLRELVSDLESL